MRAIKQPVENTSHRARVTPVVAPKKLALGEFAFALITEAAGESLLFVCAFGYRMRVGLLDDLNFVFCLAQKAIGLGQLVPFRRSDESSGAA